MCCLDCSTAYSSYLSTIPFDNFLIRIFPSWCLTWIVSVSLILNKQILVFFLTSEIISNWSETSSQKFPKFVEYLFLISTRNLIWASWSYFFFSMDHICVRNYTFFFTTYKIFTTLITQYWKPRISGPSQSPAIRSASLGTDFFFTCAENALDW